MSQIERITYIDRRLRERGWVISAEVASRFEVSGRQVVRDIAYLRDRLDAPIVWDKAERRYKYTEPWTGLAFADERALLFYVFARAAAGTIAYVPLAEEDELARLLARLPPALRNVVRAVRYDLPEYEPADIENLGLVVRAISEERCLDFAYRDAGGSASDRRVEPLRLVNYGGNWYLVAYDQGRSALRTFRLGRVRRLAIAKETADTPVSDEELERFLGSSYGMFKGPGDKRATLRFYGPALAVVRDELWHPSQQRSRGVDSRRGEYLELVLPVSRWEELLGRVLRFGADAEPVGPPELRELWETEIHRMAAAIGGQLNTC